MTNSIDDCARPSDPKKDHQQFTEHLRREVMSNSGQELIDEMNNETNNANKQRALWAFIAAVLVKVKVGFNVSYEFSMSGLRMLKHICFQGIKISWKVIKALFGTVKHLFSSNVVSLLSGTFVLSAKSVLSSASAGLLYPILAIFESIWCLLKWGWSLLRRNNNYTKHKLFYDLKNIWTSNIIACIVTVVLGAVFTLVLGALFTVAWPVIVGVLAATMIGGLCKWAYNKWKKNQQKDYLEFVKYENEKMRNNPFEKHYWPESLQDFYHIIDKFDCVDEVINCTLTEQIVRKKEKIIRDRSGELKQGGWIRKSEEAQIAFRAAILKKYCQVLEEIKQLNEYNKKKTFAEQINELIEIKQEQFNPHLEYYNNKIKENTKTKLKFYKYVDKHVKKRLENEMKEKKDALRKLKAVRCIVDECSKQKNSKCSIM